MKVAVVGAGAIGAYVGAALHRAGVDVHLIARGATLAAMRRDGVQVLTERGDFTATPPVTDDPGEVGRAAPAPGAAGSSPGRRSRAGSSARSSRGCSTTSGSS